jgi:hypothetical protein
LFGCTKYSFHLLCNTAFRTGRSIRTRTDISATGYNITGTRGEVHVKVGTCSTSMVPDGSFRRLSSEEYVILVQYGNHVPYVV